MDIPRHWRLREQRYRLIGEVCLHCNEKIFSPRAVCPACGGKGEPEPGPPADETNIFEEETDILADALVTRVLLLENA